MPKNTTDEYIPALKYDWLTPLYDSVLRLTLREATWKHALIAQAGMDKTQRVLDLGCGTATLTLLIKEAYAGADVFGLDGDPKILAMARTKLSRAHVDVTLTQGMSYALPYPEKTFDRVLSSLFFHHLTGEKKDQTFQEILRVLRPGGELHIADWGKAQDPFMRLAFLSIQLLDGFETTAEQVKGTLPERCRWAAFQNVRQTVSYRTIFGTLSLFQAQKGHGNDSSKI